MSAMSDYDQDLNELLKDPEFAAGYINAAIEDGDRDALLLAMRRVAQAQGGMAAVAARLNVKRENLYRMLSPRGNPALSSMIRILHGMGLKLAVVPSTVDAGLVAERGVPYCGDATAGDHGQQDNGKRGEPSDILDQPLQKP